MKLAAIQLVSTPRVDDNLARAAHWVREAAAQGAQFIALPEYFCLMGQRDEDKLAIAEAEGSGPIQSFLQDLARQHGVWLLGGTLPLRGEGGKVRNSSWVFDPQGQPVARYDKIHLFSFHSGFGESYDEGRVQEAGAHPTAFDCEGLRTALSICYDLRFPELYRALSPDLICAPSAFTHTTGKAHWELLLRARAVENLSYVIAPAQGGLHKNGRRTWGHSLIVDPWGEVLACVPEGEGLALATVERQRLAAVRKALPALQHRRL
ncbi:carbon-nitrogen hydrolase family protein [Inhella gelatinilytica]|uniref:Carbon-nitrogen hydrolase family protein n=1 Tax=Inhella gelatinilytica TaxID=2795030 RepID=A0A931IW41_9BURK|nr:carbon-nitrogen hydrolase family protein [Inhella gelatinilytica]MBH9551713.1 carbon-nitrogen hydrolase family protein [Inhella gelatinilytica]